MNLKLMAKRVAQGCALAWMSPVAAVCGFGKFLPVYTTCAHLIALAPGMPGNFLRAAFYKMTLRRCSIDTNISFGTYFVHPRASVGPGVSIGAYCVIAGVSIGQGTQIASHVEIPGGRHQHDRDAAGRFLDTVEGETRIGDYCWIGASAVILADVGSKAAIGAGAVVVHDIPAGAVAVGNPARVLQRAETTGNA